MSINLVVQPNESVQDFITIAKKNGGGTVSLIGDNYYLTDDLLVPSNIKIEGVGSGGSFIDFGGSDKQIKIVGDEQNPINSAFLEGITVQNSTSQLIKASYTHNLGGMDVKCVDGLVGFAIDHSDIINWNVNAIDNCGAGIMVSDCVGFTIENAFISNITASGGYVFHNSSNGVLVNSALDTVVGGGYIFINCGNIGTDQISIVNVTGHGILLDSIFTSFSITNGFVSGNSGDGMRIRNGSSNIQTMTMQFSDNGRNGINIESADCSDNIFVGNNLKNNGMANFNDNGTNTLISTNIGVADKLPNNL